MLGTHASLGDDAVAADCYAFDTAIVERRGDKLIFIKSLTLRIVVLDQNVSVHLPARLTCMAGNCLTDIIQDHHIKGIHGNCDIGCGSIFGAVRIYGKHSIVAYYQTNGLPHGDAMGLSVQDHILFDGDILVEIFDASAVLIHVLVADEQSLGGPTFANVKRVPAKGQVRRIGVPKVRDLDHIRVIAGPRNRQEIMDIVVFDQCAIDRPKGHPVGPDGVDVIVGDRQVVHIGKQQAAIPHAKFAVGNGDVTAVFNKEPSGTARAVFGF